MYIRRDRVLPTWFTDFWTNLSRTVAAITITDVLDIACLAVLFYLVYRFIRDRRAARLTVGIILFVIVMFLSEVLHMHAMRFVLQNVFQVGLISLVIIFQPELRSGLEKMGAEPIRGLRSIADLRDSASIKETIANVCDAASDLSASKTGALIVFERTTKLGDLVLTGTVINSDPTPLLIKNIFFNKAPLHDGALIIRNNRLYSAGCLLPLSSNPDLMKDLGTRHRAAVGMSENSDAVIVIVSEETGIISVANDGKLYRGFDRERLENRLQKYLLPDSAEEGKKKRKFAPRKKEK